MSKAVSPRLDTSVHGEDRWGPTSLAAVGGIRSVIPAALLAIVVLVVLNRTRLTSVRETLGADATCLHAAVAAGIDPALLHRVAAIGCGRLSSLPHNGAVVMLVGTLLVIIPLGLVFGGLYLSPMEGIIMNLNGKVPVVTGSTSGIGLDIAQVLAGAGAV